MGSSGENLPANAGDIEDSGSVPEWGRSPGGGHGNPLQFSYLEDPMNRKAWQSQIWLSNWACTGRLRSFSFSVKESFFSQIVITWEWRIDIRKKRLKTASGMGSWTTLEEGQLWLTQQSVLVAQSYLTLCDPFGQDTPCPNLSFLSPSRAPNFSEFYLAKTFGFSSSFTLCRRKLKPESLLNVRAVRGRDNLDTISWSSPVLFPWHFSTSQNGFRAFHLLFPTSLLHSYSL